MVSKTMAKLLRGLTWMQRRRKSSKLVHPSVKVQRFYTNDTKTVDPKEVEFFGSEANNWWREPNILLAMNQTRVPLIRDAFMHHHIAGDVAQSRQLDGISILDVGCGGGILSEALVRLGATVTGIDAASSMVEAAKQHASLDPSLHDRLRYLNTTSSDLVLTEAERFDGVVASEVVEHVSDLEGFLGDCVRLTKPDLGSHVLTIALGEWLGPVPRGTHQYQKFVTPERLKQILQENNCETKFLRGQMYNILTNKWSWISNTSISYALHAIKT
ncbi:putative hexaprenyldihydroxybenzoate methyltransferase, mitochondrial [Apostichopus japonicus]|uniref:Putative hexaprenyldihydroxybenzoate methyltransferase, mitochondrial n=1 Tax=Stichopus japonicus TaxID=307972 RepID=A0A2G8JYG1_STIJA|nr:putative hexaprenyldihydroxybenzoate methyltransferase, mitochondrial [Apostichopus japonicus]